MSTLTPPAAEPQRVYDRQGRRFGLLTGASHHCQMEGCCGQRLTVRWPDGKRTHPCTKGMTQRADGHLQIG